MNEKEFHEECNRLVQNDIYVNMTEWVEFVFKQPGFYDGDSDLPLTWDDIEYKDEPDEDGEEYDTYWYSAYAVSSWLADELYEHGEMVSRVPGYPHIWLRRTCGQSISIDGVIEDIVHDWLVRIGRWSEEETDTQPCEEDIEEDEINE